MSIRQKLPLLVSGLLLFVVAGYSLASYDTMKASSLDVARQRLRSLADQFSQLFEQSARNEAKALHTLATDRAIRTFVASSGRRSRTAAFDALRKGALRPELTLRADILDANGASMAATQQQPAERHEELAGLTTTAAIAPDFAAVGRFRLINDTLVYPAVAAIVNGNTAIGYIVRWRRIAATTKARDQLTALLGDKASLYVGNDWGDVWTDLVSAAPKPPSGAIEQPGSIQEYARPGGRPVLASTHPVRGVPWVVLVELDRQAVMAPAAAYFARALVLGLVVLLVGSIVIWIVSRSITRPLAELTVAASALAAGDYSTVVETHRTDELGELARAFNAMSAQVEAAHVRLEAKVHERTEQLHERNEALETFGHSISHDLRAPLRAMYGFSQALLEDCGEQLDDVGKGYAERVVAGARRMDALIQDLLAYSRVSRADVALTSLKLAEAVDDALSQLDADVRSSGATVEVTSDLPSVIGNRVALVQSLTNLIANALKFVPPGHTPAITLWAQRMHGHIRLWVQDNGIGIDHAHHERVFGVFERLHQSEDYAGTGIGLAIVRKSIERMGGHVGVESTVGAGSQFWIELPAAGAAT